MNIVNNIFICSVMYKKNNYGNKFLQLIANVHNFDDHFNFQNIVFTIHQTLITLVAFKDLIST